MTCNNSKQHLINCEIRYWLIKGYVTPAKLNELKDSVAKYRGIAGANKLVERIKWALDNWRKTA